MSGSATDLSSSQDFEVLATAASHDFGNAKLCRAIRSESAGDLVVKKADGSTATLPFLAGEVQEIVVAGIGTGSTVTGRITVYY